MTTRNTQYMPHNWTPAEDELLRDAFAEGLTRSKFKSLRKQLDVSRHQLRNRLHTLQLTDYGKQRYGPLPSTMTNDAKGRPSPEDRHKPIPPASSANLQFATSEDPAELEISDNELRLERKILVLTDELSGLRKRIKRLHRNECLLEAVLEEVRNSTTPIAVPDPIQRSTKAGPHKEDLVVHLSDEHADQIVLPHRVGGLEEYNLRVAMARAEHFVDSVIRLSQETMVNYEFENLWVLAYGDHVNGEIHDSTNHSEYQNAIRNAIAVGQMHALMFRDWKPYFKKVNVIYVAGNHGRFGPKKDFRGAQQNWDYLVAETARQALRDEPDIEILAPDSYSVTVDINGWTFHISHGDDVKCTNSLPFYGLERRSRRLAALHAAVGRQIHYYCIGHFHSLSSLPTPNGEMLVNGSWKATDEWSYEALGAVGRPMQWIHGVHRDVGISWRIPVYLKFDGDVNGPKRYKIDLAEAA